MPAAAESPCVTLSLGPGTPESGSADPATAAAPDPRDRLAEQSRGRVGQQDLTTMPGGHHPCSTIQHRTEVIPIPQFGFAGRQPHPHRQLQCPLCGHRRIHRRARRGERGTHPSPVCLNNQPPCASIASRNTSSWAARAIRMLVRVGFPPTGRTLNVGEQKRHDTRRSGHLCRMSQPTLFHLEHHRTTQDNRSWGGPGRP